MLNAMEMVDYLRVNPLMPKGSYDAFDYALDGMAVLLRVIDIRTYGGLVKMYMDEEGNALNTGSTSVPLISRRPYNLAQQTAYIIRFHLGIHDLPENIIAKVVPTQIASQLGILMNETYIKEGEIFIPVLILRKVELSDGYPLAHLVFDIKEDMVLTDNDESEDLSEEPKKATKNGKNSNAKNSSTGN